MNLFACHSRVYAVADSLISRTKLAPTIASSTSSRECPTIEQMIKAMALDVAMRYPVLNDPRGDTYVFIDAPPKQPEQDLFSYQNYCERSRVPIIIKSSTLGALKSPVFDKLLGPTSQYRVKRRRGLIGNLPDSNYVLDLTPSTEGDDAVHLLTQMCCPESVRKWRIAGNLWPISTTLIDGQEDFSSKFDTTNGYSSSSAKRVLARLGNLDSLDKEMHLLLKENEAATSLSVEYSPILHRSAINRLLHAVSNIDPGLDSASKVWTISVLAAEFQAHESSELLGFVVSWVHRNSYFVEVLPEATLMIADNLKCYDLCRCAFAILVGEEAFESIYYKGKQGSGVTPYGRKKEDLPEEYRTRIEYASKTFSDRIMSEFETLARADWLEQLPEFLKLSQFKPHELESPSGVRYQAAVDYLKESLKLYIGGAIYRLLCADYPLHKSRALPEWHYAQTNSLFPIKGANEQTAFWNSLLPYERVLTYSFWVSLDERYLFTGPTNMCIDAKEGYDNPFCQPSGPERSLREEKVFEEVSLDQVEKAVEDLEAARACLLVAETIMRTTDPGTQHVQDQEKPKRDPSTQLDADGSFNLFIFFDEADIYLKKMSARMTAYTNSDFRKDTDHQPLVDVLGCIEDSEWKFLPLWAGGCDDGSGGVYEDDHPNASAGFSHPGPNIHCGPDSIAASSEFDFIQGPNTHNTSTITNAFSNHRMSSKVESDTFTNRESSAFGDSEYDFGSTASVDEETDHHQVLAMSTANIHKPLSSKAIGKMPLRPKDPAAMAENLRRLESEEVNLVGDLEAQEASPKRKRSVHSPDEWRIPTTASDLSASEKLLHGKTRKTESHTSTADEDYDSLFLEHSDEDSGEGTVVGDDTDDEDDHFSTADCDECEDDFLGFDD